jgi:cell division protein FtsI (penicillin-binding protein 3)
MQQVLEYLHVPHDMTLPPNRQVWLAQNRVKDSDLDENSPDHLGAALEVSDAPTSSSLPPAPQKPSAAQGAVVPAALRQRETPPASNTAVSAPPSSSAASPSGQAPTNGTVVLEVEQGGIEVPSFLGKSVRSAIETAQDSGLELNPVGSGIAREQNPAPGAHVASGSTIIVRFGR